MVSRLKNLGGKGGQEVCMYWDGGRIGRILSPVINVFLQLDVDCVSYHLGDHRTERLVNSITVVTRYC
jgi:hypothetical protein